MPIKKHHPTSPSNEVVNFRKQEGQKSFQNSGQNAVFITPEVEGGKIGWRTRASAGTDTYGDDEETDYPEVSVPLPKLHWSGTKWVTLLPSSSSSSGDDKSTKAVSIVSNKNQDQWQHSTTQETGRRKKVRKGSWEEDNRKSVKSKSVINTPSERTQRTIRSSSEKNVKPFLPLDVAESRSKTKRKNRPYYTPFSASANRKPKAERKPGLSPTKDGTESAKKNPATSSRSSLDLQKSKKEVVRGKGTAMVRRVIYLGPAPSKRLDDAPSLPVFLAKGKPKKVDGLKKDSSGRVRLKRSKESQEIYRGFLLTKSKDRIVSYLQKPEVLENLRKEAKKRGKSVVVSDKVIELEIWPKLRNLQAEKRSRSRSRSSRSSSLKDNVRGSREHHGRKHSDPKKPQIIEIPDDGLGNHSKQSIENVLPFVPSQGRTSSKLTRAASIVAMAKEMAAAAAAGNTELPGRKHRTSKVAPGAEVDRKTDKYLLVNVISYFN
jgi:hypothetical protein